MLTKFNDKLGMELFFHLSVCDRFYGGEFHGNPNGQCSMKNAESLVVNVRWYNSIRVSAWDRLTMSA